MDTLYTPLQEVERLIKQLENPIRSAKIKASEQLLSVSISPDLISKSQFFDNVISPILHQFSNDTEGVRENCIKAVFNFSTQIGIENLQNIFNLVLPPIFDRLKDEKVEPAEQIRFFLMKFILAIIKMVSPETTPNNLTECISHFVGPLSTSFKSNDAEMKKLGCQVLNESLSRCESVDLSEFSISLSNLILANCTHRHFDVRRLSLESLSNLYVSAGTFDDVDKLSTLLQKLAYDRNSNVRKAVSFFCEHILTKHKNKKLIYCPILIPLLYFAKPVVPLRSLDVVSSIEKININDEAQISFEALNKIGSEYSKSINVTSEGRLFDEAHFANEGVVQLIRDFSEKLLEILLPLMTDWTEMHRNYGYSAIRTFLQIGGSYIQRYAPHITQKLTISLRDRNDDADNALQCQSILASFVPAKDLIDILIPRITSEKPKEIFMLITATCINGSVEIESIESIVNKYIKEKVYEELSCVDIFVQFVLAILKKSADFPKSLNENILIFILKISEKTNSLEKISYAFPHPISEVLSKYFGTLLKYEDKNPEYLSNLLLNVDVSVVKENQQQVCQELSAALRSTSKKIQIEKLVNSLIEKKAIENLSLESIQNFPKNE